jgi:cyanate lyase
MVVAAKAEKQLTWAEIAVAVGQSKEWTTAALLGQMTLTERQAKAVGDMLSLPEDAVAMLQVVPDRGSLATAVPTAIDFRMDIAREPDPAGDRVRIVMSGKFLPYRTY